MKNLNQYIPIVALGFLLGGMIFGMFIFATRLQNIADTQKQRAVVGDGLIKIVQSDHELLVNCIK